MTSTVSASRLAIADPRPQARKDGSKEQSAFQDAFRTAGTERRGGTASAGQTLAAPSKGLAHQLEALAKVGFRLSGEVTEVSPPRIAKPSDDLNEEQDASRLADAERYVGAVAAGRAIAAPSTGLAHQVETLTDENRRLSGEATEASATITTIPLDGEVEASGPIGGMAEPTTQLHFHAETTAPGRRSAAEQPSLVDSNLPATPLEGDLDRAGKSEATKQVRAEASARVPKTDLPAGRIPAPFDEVEPTEPEANGSKAEEAGIEAAFPMMQDALRIPRQQTPVVADETSETAPSPAAGTARDDTLTDTAVATARSGAPKAAASLSATASPPRSAKAADKAETATLVDRSATSPEVPASSAPRPSVEQPAFGTIAVPPAPSTPRGPATDKAGSRTSDSSPATSADRTQSSSTNVQSPADTAAAAPSAETADRTPPPREPVEHEAKDDSKNPGVSDTRSGETARPVPNGVTAVTAQSAQATPTTAPAAAIIASVRAEASWAAYFRDTQPGAPAQLKSLKIQLNPVELGAVTAHLRIKDDAVTVELSAETADAQRQLTSDADTIVKSLRALGLDVDRVTVQLTGRSDPQPRAEPNGQSRQQGFAADGGAGGAREQGSGSQREQQQSGGQNTHAAGPPGAAPNGSSSARYI